MSDPNKTVFISYRRDVSKYLALMIFKDLQQNGYDVFLDVEKIDSGSWESVILNQIAARTHFVLLLTPGTLDRCIDHNDVLRREIEQAIHLGRNIVPLFADKFELKTAGEFLVGDLSNLPKFNGMNLYDDMIEESLIKLRERFLKTPVYRPTLIPAPSKDQPQAQQIIVETTSQPAPTQEELSAEQFFSRAREKSRKGYFDDAIVDYTHAIQLKPDYVVAHYNRGEAYRKKGLFDSAIVDYTQAIQLKSDYATAFNNRGLAQRNLGKLDLAIADYTQAIQLKSDYFLAYCNRGEAYFMTGHLGNALNDFKKANELLSADHSALAGLAITHHAMDNKQEAYRLWKILMSIDARYKDIDWVKKELNWAEPLVQEAQKLVAGL